VVGLQKLLNEKKMGKLIYNQIERQILINGKSDFFQLNFAVLKFKQAIHKLISPYLLPIINCLNQ
jgi:hypothetical protein